MPDGAGRLVPASEQLNGPSGRALDDRFLSPLGFDRNDAWLCDLLPESRCNPKQAAALEREYQPAMARFRLPAYDFPAVPSPLVDSERISEIEREISEASPELLITLGDQPLKWFTRRYGSKPRLSAYGEGNDTYGRIHKIVIGSRNLGLLPLVHPRQAAKLGSYSPKWHNLHLNWERDIAPTLVSACG
jgi:uracil-DNA glycosylase